ncbi:MAG: hypothetical protein AAB638_00480 [Patescibacteria group bacterium]
MKKSNLRKFDPHKIALLEREMWEAYYGHNFLKLSLLLVKLAHVFFQSNYIHSVVVAYYMARAAIDFRSHKGREDHQRIIKNLTKAYKIISENNVEKFDYRKTAELELGWWLVDRYPERYQVSRRDALASHMASIYGVPAMSLMNYAEYRALAMETQDKAEEEKTEADWDKIESLLKTSFGALHKAVQ